VVVIRPFEHTDEAQVIALWEECGLWRRWNDPYLDIARSQDVEDGLFLVAEKDGAVVGTVMAGYDGHRGSINYVGSDLPIKGGDRAGIDAGGRESAPCPRLPQDKSSSSGGKPRSGRVLSPTRLRDVHGRRYGQATDSGLMFKV